MFLHTSFTLQPLSIFLYISHFFSAALLVNNNVTVLFLLSWDEIVNTGELYLQKQLKWVGP